MISLIWRWVLGTDSTEFERDGSGIGLHKGPQAFQVFQWTHSNYSIIFQWQGGSSLFLDIRPIRPLLNSHVFIIHSGWEGKTLTSVFDPKNCGTMFWGILCIRALAKVFRYVAEMFWHVLVLLFCNWFLACSMLQKWLRHWSLVPVTPAEHSLFGILGAFGRCGSPGSPRGDRGVGKRRLVPKNAAGSTKMIHTRRREGHPKSLQCQG